MVLATRSGSTIGTRTAENSMMHPSIRVPQEKSHVTSERVLSLRVRFFLPTSLVSMRFTFDKRPISRFYTVVILCLFSWSSVLAEIMALVVGYSALQAVKCCCWKYRWVNEVGGVAVVALSRPRSQLFMALISTPQRKNIRLTCRCCIGPFLKSELVQCFFDAWHAPKYVEEICKSMVCRPASIGMGCSSASLSMLDQVGWW